MMITGSSFFVVRKGTGEDAEELYTRDGTFGLDAQGNLVTQQDGYFVMGWMPVTDKDGTVKPIDPEKDPLVPLRLMTPDNMKTPPEATSLARITGNLDKQDAGLTGKDGKTFQFSFMDNLGYMYTADLNIKAVPDKKGQYSLSLLDIKDRNGISIGAEEMKKVSLSGEGFEKGIDDGSVLIRFDEADGKYAGPFTAGSDGTKSFNSLKLNFEPDSSGGTNSWSDVTINVSQMTNYNSSGKSTIRAVRGDGEGKGEGKSLGIMTGMSVSSNGVISASYSNGDTVTLGQIATAAFDNPQGLEKAGNNLYSASSNSGIARRGDVSKDGGSISTGGLEMANVDLAKEFTDMITTQRGYQANTRIITVSDTVLEEMINLKK
jgi:flagellar hook protein FlgE